MSRLILASKSPRRQELLKSMGLEFEVVLREVNEDFPSDMDPEAAVRHIAEKKARAFADLAGEAVILTADTIVVMDGQVLGKPLDAAEATTFLERLSGREHQVMTACAILHGEKLHSFVETTRVRFRELEATEIAHYVQSGLPMDKAGAYGIQEWIGLIGITRIEGSYQNVVGLPTAGLYAALKTHFPDIVRNTALKRHFPFSMVTLMAILLTGLLFSACGINQQASALKALRNCKFELVGVDSLTLAGTDLSPLLKGENINLSRVPAIAFGYLNQNLPLAASMQLQVENPTKKLAGIRQFQYVVLLDNTEILDGTSDLALEVPAGTTTVTPVRLQANIYKLITNGDNLQKLLAFFEREGSNASHQVDLTFKIKPTLSLGNKAIDYPGYITVQKKLDKASISRWISR